MAKSRKSLQRRQQKKRARAQKNRRARHFSRTGSGRDGYPVFPEPMLDTGDVTCPRGFRTVRAGQAMQEYGKALFREFEARRNRTPDGMEELEQIFGVVGACWNYALSVRNECPSAEVRSQIVEELQALFPESASVDDLLSMMISRYEYLFPKELSRQGGGCFIIRNEYEGELDQIDEQAWAVSPVERPLEEDEQKFLDELNRLDAMIRAGDDFSEYESLSHDVIDLGMGCFEKWLATRSLPSIAVDMFCLFLQFLYEYGVGEGDGTLCQVPRYTFWEFLNEHLVLKTGFPPADLLKAPSTLKTIAVWLSEIGYPVRHEEWARIIDSQKEEFFALVRKRYQRVV